MAANAPSSDGDTTMPKWVVAVLMIVLLVVGLVVIGITVGLHNTTTTTSKVTEVSTSTTSGNAPSSGGAAATSSSSASSSTSAATPPVQVVTGSKTTTTAGNLSDATVGTLITVGALICLVGAAYPRVTKVVFPGGAEIDMDSLLKQAAASVATAAAKSTHRARLAGRRPDQLAPTLADAIGRTAQQMRLQGIAPLKPKPARGRRQMVAGDDPDAIADHVLADVLGED